nr:DUF4123 domain-containing protein [Methylobacterium sp. OTU13CASTA1]
MAGAGRAGVIWSTSADEPSLYSHLRSLNHVLLPSGERVYFRQADPNVMNALLPLLDAGQASRLLGPASALVFESAEAGGARRVLRPDGLPEAPSAELAFTDDQIDVLNKRQQHLSRVRIMAYLRQTAPEHAGTRSDAELYQDVVRYETSARDLGLSSERAIGKWAHLMAMSNETIGAGEGPVRGYLSGKPGPADAKLEALITAMTGEAHRAEGSQ